MDFLTFLFALAVLLAFLLHRFAGRSASKSTNRSTAAPEPPAAVPLIGHLHLLTAKAPAARTLACLADKHGAIFSLRLGSHRALVVSGWDAVGQCFTVNDTAFASLPLMAVGKYMGNKHPGFALAPYGAYWRHVRKMVTVELMTTHLLEKLWHVRESEVNLALRDLHVRWTRGGKMEARVAMNSWFEHVTFNIIVRMLAGKRYSGDGEDEGLEAAAKGALYLSGLFVVSDVILWLEWADIGGHLRKMKKTGKEVDAVLGRWLEEHI